MSKLRSINTCIWSDPWIEELSPIEKLLFIYLITNEKTNMLGIYEASIKKISFETGIESVEVDNALKGFERVGKVKYTNNYIILVNFMKHQNYNPNMKKNAIDIYNNLPKSLGINTIQISKDKPIEGFESLLKALAMVRKVEVEFEVESEIEEEEEVEGESKKYDIGFDSTNNIKNFYISKFQISYNDLCLKHGKSVVDEMLEEFGEFHNNGSWQNENDLRKHVMSYMLKRPEKKEKEKFPAKRKELNMDIIMKKQS